MLLDRLPDEREPHPHEPCRRHVSAVPLATSHEKPDVSAEEPSGDGDAGNVEPDERVRLRQRFGDLVPVHALDHPFGRRDAGSEALRENIGSNVGIIRMESEGVDFHVWNAERGREFGGQR